MTDDRAAIAERDGWLCWRCGADCRTGLGGNVQHRKNRSQGGGNLPSNRLVLCGNGTMGCHGWVTTHPSLAQLAGWTVASYMVPSQVSAWHAPSGQWRLLDDDYRWHGCGSGHPPEEALCAKRV